MIKILLTVKNTLFRQSLKLFLENKGIAFIYEADHLDDIVIQKYLPEIVITELLNDSTGFKLFENLVPLFPDVKFMVISHLLNLDEFNQLVNSGVKGCVLNTSDLSELATALDEIALGKTYYPQEVLQKIIFNQPSGSKDVNALTNREEEILRLLCDGLSNEQISEKLHLSYDTVKWHRSNILIKCGCKNILSLYKYAVLNELV